MISQRGEIWYVNFDPIRGHEQARTRPAVVVSRPEVTHALGMAAVVALTRTNRGWGSHVAVEATAQTGLRSRSFALIEQIRSVDVSQRFGKHLGLVDADTLDEIDRKLKALFGWSSL